MILQSLLFPSEQSCDRTALFFRTEGPSSYCLGDASIQCEKGAVISLDTYFSGFSVGKWMKYTSLTTLRLALHLQGGFHIAVLHAERVRGETVSQTILTHTHRREDGENCSLEIQNLKENGVYYARLRCLENSSAYLGGAYVTDIEDAKDIRLALAICTYKREAYIQRNIALLTRDILDNPSSPLYGKMELFIADNGRTLCNTHNTDTVHILLNKNSGGSGGFARAMLEVLSRKDEFTHIIMMDDDIVLPGETLLRTASFLSLLKEAYKDAFLGGAMMELDRPEIQNTLINNWAGGNSIAVKAGYDMTDFDNVVRNEIEETANHFGWWYCCMPIDVVREDNLPLPLFIKRDDVEYSVRMRPPLITLNGVCVWHESFIRKRSPHLEYYFWRNTCVVGALHRPGYEKSQRKLRRGLRRYILDKCDMLRYKDAHLALRGVEDFLKGPDFLMDADPEALNTSVMNGGYKAVPVGPLKMTFRLNAYEQSLKPAPIGKVRAFFHKLTLNGQLLKAKNQPVAPAVGAAKEQLYRAKTALYYVEANETGFLVKKSFKARFRVYRRYLTVSRLLRGRLKPVTDEYKQRFPALTSVSYWAMYLSEETIGTRNFARPKGRTLKQFLIDYGKFFAIFMIRLCQHLLAFWPVKKNRITLVVYGRKGYACNPKYIAEYLLRAYPGKYELVWATQYPESCDEVREKGIRVVAYQSLAHLRAHFTSKYVIVNDRVPSYFVVRGKQVLVNAWHGGMNYKKIGLERLNFPYRFQRIVYAWQNIEPKLFVSGSRFFTENTASAFGFEEKVFWGSGLPRNDILLGDVSGIAQTVRAAFGLRDGVRVVLYAPTFRDDLAAKTFGLDFERVLGALNERFGGDWVMLYRAHGFATGKALGLTDRVIDASGYGDMQALLCAADVLISDYSSCFWDYGLLNRPMFSFAPDWARYRVRERDFAYPVEKWPFAVAKDNDKLCAEITAFDEGIFAEKVRRHLDDAGSYDKGDAAKQVIASMLTDRP